VTHPVLVFTGNFRRSFKRLHKNQQRDVLKAVDEISANPLIGEQKKGDLNVLRVHKFKMIGQMTLIAYTWEEDIITLTLLAFGSHENFYRDLKKKG
jgi:mRNA-degrading endonuclease RelE of RelBE toxin-antitoxin system